MNGTNHRKLLGYVALDGDLVTFGSNRTNYSPDTCVSSKGGSGSDSLVALFCDPVK